jgi:PPOX class probable F420-dependent enzyme
MALDLTDDQRAIIESPNFAYIATVNKDGSPQVTPVWIEHDGNYIVVNSEQKRLKVRNVKRDPRVSLNVAEAANPYHYLTIKGHVVEVTAEGGFEGIDRLAKKYIGQDKYPWNKPEDVRVQIRIAVDKISTPQ